jgi:hypothetical protein
MNSNANPTGSGRSVSDYTAFCEGDVEPSLNKKIHLLIQKDRNHIVFVDEDGSVEWAFNGETPGQFEDVANEIGDLETLSTQL